MRWRIESVAVSWVFGSEIESCMTRRTEGAEDGPHSDWRTSLSESDGLWRYNGEVRRCRVARVEDE
jgi:hypothetical protein